MSSRITILEGRLLKAVSEERKQELIEEFRRKEHEYLRFKRTKLSPDDFITLQVIGKGAFGTVIAGNASTISLGQIGTKEGHG